MSGAQFFQDAEVDRDSVLDNLASLVFRCFQLPREAARRLPLTMASAETRLETRH